MAISRIRLMGAHSLSDDVDHGRDDEVLSSRSLFASGADAFETSAPAGNDRRLVSGLSGGVHLLTKAARPHVGPDLVDIGHAVGLAALFADGPPAGRDVVVDQPERVLFLVVDQNLIPGVVIHLIFLSHSVYLSPESRNSAAPVP